MGKTVNIAYTHELRDEDGEESAGLCDSGNNTIHICTKENKSEEDILSTLGHEMIHFVIAKSGLSELIGDKEESLVIVLEEHLLPLFSHNRKKWRKRKEVGNEG